MNLLSDIEFLHHGYVNILSNVSKYDKELTVHAQQLSTIIYIIYVFIIWCITLTLFVLYVKQPYCSLKLCQIIVTIYIW